LHEAAERAYCELAGRSDPGPAELEAATAALSVFMPFYEIGGRYVERAEFEAGLERLRRAGVRFSQVMRA
jgi:hypothetical protein